MNEWLQGHPAPRQLSSFVKVATGSGFKAPGQQSEAYNNLQKKTKEVMALTNKFGALQCDNVEDDDNEE